MNLRRKPCARTPHDGVAFTGTPWIDVCSLKRTMVARDADPAGDGFREELVAFLAKRLGVSHDVALSTLGDWLIEFERTHAVVPKPEHEHE